MAFPAQALPSLCRAERDPERDPFFLPLIPLLNKVQNSWRIKKNSSTKTRWGSSGAGRQRGRVMGYKEICVLLSLPCRGSAPQTLSPWPHSTPAPHPVSPGYPNPTLHTSLQPHSTSNPHPTASQHPSPSPHGPTAAPLCRPLTHFP